MSSLNPNFLIGNLRIGSVEGASCINLGNNFPIDFQSFKKQNQGFGNMTGDNNQSSDMKSFLADIENQEEFLEIIKNLNDEDLPKWFKDLIASEYCKDIEVV
nr:hypothetical protein [Anaerobacillus isosaccharinicus]MBA5587210.1 hypothetical protein [Anaerobacillus isosaccharinicus]QOY34596.1 hypothetical protein AWH56_017955 [Anaerobacillus isosaccharinicus]